MQVVWVRLAQVLRIPGYIADEKVHIARNYLEPQTMRDTGIPPQSASINDSAMATLINEYCRYGSVWAVCDFPMDDCRGLYISCTGYSLACRRQ